MRTGEEDGEAGRRDGYVWGRGREEPSSCQPPSGHTYYPKEGGRQAGISSANNNLSHHVYIYICIFYILYMLLYFSVYICICLLFSYICMYVYLPSCLSVVKLHL